MGGTEIISFIITGLVSSTLSIVGSHQLIVYKVNENKRAIEKQKEVDDKVMREHGSFDVSIKGLNDAKDRHDKDISTLFKKADEQQTSHNELRLVVAEINSVLKLIDNRTERTEAKTEMIYNRLFNEKPRGDLLSTQ